MSRSTTERVVHVVAAAAAVVVATMAVPISGELELFLVMLTAVIAGLLCFDTAMESAWKSFIPWLFLSLAPVARTVPIVWSDLQTEDSGIDERFDHLGALLFGVFVLAAVWWVSRPARRLGAQGTLYDSAVIVGSAVTVGLAGTSVAFLYDADFESVPVARMLESTTWTILGGLLAAIAVAASRPVRLTPALGAVLVVAAATVGLLAYTVAGRDVDVGWWALLFAGFAVSAGAFDSSALGQRQERSRPTSTGTIVALVMGLGAAAAAISARSDGDSWAPGWWALGAMSLIMLALAMASAPVEELRREDAGLDTTDVDFASDPAAMFGPEAGAETRLASVFGAEAEAEARLASMFTSSATADQFDEANPAAVASAASAATAFRAAAAVIPTVHPRAEAAHEAIRIPVAAELAVDSELVADAELSADAEPVPAGPNAALNPVSDIAPDTAPGSVSDIAPDTALNPVSDIAPDTAPGSAPDRVLDPIGIAHHIDPSTGLLSSAGLQHALAAAFATAPVGGDLTLMMFMVRDLDEIERQHGRLASATVTRAIAQRVPKLMPDGTGARFARTGYAVIFEGDLGDPKALVQHLARVLLQLRAPIEGPTPVGALGDNIDVVAGMAQAYAGEHPVDFVKRANLGLARAAQTPEPTLVAMP